MHQGFLPPCDLLHQPRRDVHIEAANCTNIESWAGQKMQCAGAGAQHEQCSLHHILMVQSGACLPHCYLWPHERSPHLWPSFTALLRRASKQKRLCVPAAALWSHDDIRPEYSSRGRDIIQAGDAAWWCWPGPGGGAPAPWEPGIVRGSLNRIVTRSLLAQFWALPELTNTAFDPPPSY